MQTIKKIYVRSEDFVKDVVSNPPKECVPWPYSKTIRGYPRIVVKGRHMTAHRYAYILYTGIEEKSLEAAHNCGVKDCVNPTHIRWATSKENHADRLKHGTAQRGEDATNVKLTEKQVISIRKDYRTHEVIAKDYLVARQTISKIKSRRAWAWL